MPPSFLVNVGDEFFVESFIHRVSSTGTEPVVFVLTHSEGAVLQEAFGNGAVATMIGKSERGGKFVHLN